MRPSKRTEILAATARVVEREGIAAVTYDSVAAESGMTKGGLVYHFPSRETLIEGLHQHLANKWESAIADVAGRWSAEPSDIQRLESYVRVAALGTTRAELLLLLEGSTTPKLAAPWKSVLERWTPSVPTSTSDTVATEQFIARLAADGLWVYESLAAEPLDPILRREIAERIIEFISRPPTVEKDTSDE